MMKEAEVGGIQDFTSGTDEGQISITSEYSVLCATHLHSRDIWPQPNFFCKCKTQPMEPANLTYSPGSCQVGFEVILPDTHWELRNHIPKLQSSFSNGHPGWLAEVHHSLLDRGWRRSGNFLYKPEMEKTCCPSYTIRLKASDFVRSKEQLRVSKRMQRFLDGTLDVRKSGEQMEMATTSDQHISHKETASSVPNGVSSSNRLQKSNCEQVQYLSDQIDSAICACTEQGDFPSDIQFPRASVKSVAPAKRKLLAEGPETLLYSSNVSFQIAAVLRRAGKSVHVNAEEGSQSTEPTPKLIAEKLSSHMSILVEAFGLLIKACNGHINFYSTVDNSSDIVVEKAVTSTESSSGRGKRDSCWNESSRRFQEKTKRIEIRLTRSKFDPEEYALYRKYQLKVHNDIPDHVTETSYRGFLVESPLIFVPSRGDSTTPSCGFGSFHQQYLINGRLVAVGVIDILPKCVSSKYLFWDPDLAFLSLGKYSALQEINWVRVNQLQCPSLQYYYLGYYIHSCNKMRYKAAYHPSELLCPLRYQWVPFDISKKLLDRKPYVVLSDFATLQDEEVISTVLEDYVEENDDCFPEEANDVPIDDDEEMSEIDSEESADESGPETTSLNQLEVEKVDVGNIMIGLNGMHLRYKDIQQAFDPNKRSYLETQLHKYARAVGMDLSGRMIYLLS